MSSDVIESKVQSADGTSIAYDRRGAGPPLVPVGGAFQYRASVLSDGGTRTLPGQTHDVAPDALAPVLEKFLASERVGR